MKIKKDLRQKKASRPRRRQGYRRSAGERSFDIANIVFMILLCVCTFYPFWYVLVMSLNEGSDAAKGPIWLWPREFTWENYAYTLRNPHIIQAFLVTTARAITGPVLSVGIMLLAAYALSKRYLKYRKAYLYFFLIPLFIGGNIITNYLIMAKLGLLNNFLVYILPAAFIFFHMIIIRTFIEQLPEEMEESAMIDGAGYVQIFLKIAVPLSKPVVAAMLFFSVVGHWLDLSANLLYVTKADLSTLQYVLYRIILSSQPGEMNLANVLSKLSSLSSGTLPTPQVLKMAALVTVTFPLLFVYPFFQKYFVKGMLVGAIKA